MKPCAICFCFICPMGNSILMSGILLIELTIAHPSLKLETFK